MVKTEQKARAKKSKSKKVKVLILRTAGTNCDEETAFCFRSVGSDVDLVHINRLAEGEKDLSKYHIFVLPGGFTYGDDIASGKILANELRHRLGDEVQRFIEDGKLIVGICNGFQVLVKAGYLPGIDGMGGVEATLTLNDSARFEDRWVYLKKPKTKNQKSKNKCIWTDGIEDIIYLPVAHAEGKFIPRDESMLKKLWENNQVVFQYVDEKGNLAGFPHNPNGSIDNIAGICDPTGRIFGLMPHPERHFLPTHHPRWTRQGPAGEGDGAKIFRNGVEFAARNLV